MPNKIVERIVSLRKDEIGQSFLVFCIRPVGVYLLRNRKAIAVSLFDEYLRFLNGEDVTASYIREFENDIIGFDIAFDYETDKIMRLIIDSSGKQSECCISIRYLEVLDCPNVDAKTVHTEYSNLIKSELVTDKIQYLINAASKDSFSC